jgi:hypothetical protein
MDDIVRVLLIKERLEFGINDVVRRSDAVCRIAYNVLVETHRLKRFNVHIVLGVTIKRKCCSMFHNKRLVWYKQRLNYNYQNGINQLKSHNILQYRVCAYVSSIGHHAVWPMMARRAEFKSQLIQKGNSGHRMFLRKTEPWLRFAVRQ